MSYIQVEHSIPYFTQVEDKLGQTKVERGRKTKPYKLIATHQAYINDGNLEILEIRPSPTPTSAVFQSSGQIQFTIAPENLHKVRNVYLRCKISVASAAVTCQPFNFWFDRIEFEAQGNIICKYYPETFLVNESLLSEQQDIAHQEMVGFVRKDMHLSSAKFWRKLKIEANETRHLYLPIIGTFLENEHIYWPHLKNKIVVTAYINGSSDWLVSGTASNVSLSSGDAKLVIEQEKLSVKDKANHKKAYDEVTDDLVYRYLDCSKLSDATQAATAGNDTFYNLQSFTGKYSHLAFCHRPAAKPVASDDSIIDFMDLGPNTKINLLDSNNDPLFGKGSSVLADYVHRKLFSQQFNRKPIDGLYVLPFSRNLRMSYEGIIDGYIELKPSHSERLKITYDSAPTEEVQTITQSSGAATGGQLKLFIDGHMTSSLDHDTGAADLKAALDALPPIADRGISTTFNQAFDDGAAVTCTFSTTNDSDNAGKVNEYIGTLHVIHEDLATATNCTNSITTAGVRGWTTVSSGNTEMAIYGFKFRELHVSSDGTMIVKDS